MGGASASAGRAAEGTSEESYFHSVTSIMSLAYQETVSTRSTFLALSTVGSTFIMLRTACAYLLAATLLPLAHVEAQLDDAIFSGQTCGPEVRPRVGS